MKKKFIFFGVFVAALIVSPVSAQVKSQEPLPTSVPTPIDNTDKYELSQFGFTETRLIGPFDSTGIQVSFPEEWRFGQPALLHLNFTLSIYGGDYFEGISQIGGVIAISANNKNLAVIPLDEIGDNEVEISITPENLISERTDGRFDLSFDLISEESCTRDIDVDVIIRENSYLKLPHTSASPLIDLTRFPRPFYQPNSIDERKALLVVPDQPSNGELQAAMDISGGLGNLTDGNLLVELVSYSDLSKEMINTENLILVGKPASIPIIADLVLPARFENSQFNYSGAEMDDGLIQEIVSPWNNAKAILVVSGNTDLGLVKSGQAIKSGELLTTDRDDVALVQEFRPQMPPTTLALNQSFKDLGYGDRTVNYAGTSFIYIDFYIPTQQFVGDDAFLNLHFSHSSILENEASGITILLKGRAINSIQFQESTSQLAETQIKLPSSAFLQGPNQLLIQLRLVPLNECTQLGNFNSTWATLFGDSSLHLPTTPASGGIIQRVNLADYPQVIAAGQTLGNLVFVLDKSNKSDLKAASAVAYGLGDRAGKFLNQISIMDAKSIASDLLADKNVVIIGRPNDILLLQEIHDSLPAPFESGSEVPLDPASQIVYRVLPNSEVGYLELFNSPWDSQRMVLLVTGNSENGLNLAVNALNGGDFQGSLSGNFAIISSGRIIGLDTRFPVESALLDGQDQKKGEDSALAGDVLPTQPGKKWMLPAIIVVSVMTIGVAIVALRAALKKSKVVG